MLFLNPAYLAAFLFGLRISVLFNELRISIVLSIQGRSVLEFKSVFKCCYCLNIDQDRLNIVLTM